MIDVKVLGALAQSLTDKRFRSLARLIEGNIGVGEPSGLLYDCRGNVYVGGVARIQESEYEEYFGKKLSNEERQAVFEILPHIPGRKPSCDDKIPDGVLPENSRLGIFDYAKVFDDGLVQFVQHGEYWQSKPGNAWVVYGHVNSSLRLAPIPQILERRIVKTEQAKPKRTRKRDSK